MRLGRAPTALLVRTTVPRLPYPQTYSLPPVVLARTRARQAGRARRVTSSSGRSATPPEGRGNAAGQRCGGPTQQGRQVAECSALTSGSCLGGMVGNVATGDAVDPSTAVTRGTVGAGWWVEALPVPEFTALMVSRLGDA